MTSTPVFIGLPVYNGERFIETAIDALLSQTYTNWKLLIADNASTDATADIAKRYVESDPRIHYVRHAENQGAFVNFDYVLKQAEGDFFMWAAADDEWDPRFLESCIALLERDPDVDFAFTDMVNIDQWSRVVRRYPSFRRFSRGPHWLCVLRFLLDYAIMGKGNLLYSVFRLDSLKKSWPRLRKIWLDKDCETAGGGMGWLMGFLARSRLAIHPEPLFRKRWVIADAVPEKTYFFDWKGKLKYSHPNPEHSIYCRYHIEACRGTIWYLPALILMRIRHWRLRLYRFRRARRERRVGREGRAVVDQG